MRKLIRCRPEPENLYSGRVTMSVDTFSKIEVDVTKLIVLDGKECMSAKIITQWMVSAAELRNKGDEQYILMPFSERWRA